MRDQANLGGDNAKWIILDGDIDPMLVDAQICRTSCLVHGEWSIFSHFSSLFLFIKVD